MSIESVMPSNHLVICHSFLLLPSVFPSIRDFSNESAFLIKWPKYWNFSFSISPSNEYSELISFRITPQFKNIDSSVFSLLYGPTLTSIHNYWKNHNFNCMGLCCQSGISAFKCLGVSRFVIAFLPRTKSLFMATVIICNDFGAQEKKIWHCFYFFSFCLPWSDGSRTYDLSFLNVVFKNQLFHSLLSLSSRGSLIPIQFLQLQLYHLHISVISSAYFRLLIFKLHKSIETNSKLVID